MIVMYFYIAFSLFQFVVFFEMKFVSLIELSSFFRELCSKTLSLDTLHLLEKSIVLTLCKLENIPSFLFLT